MTSLVIPLLAIQTLGAGPQQMAVLQAASTAPYLLFGLFAGHWLSGRSLRHVMIALDLIRSLVVFSVAAAIFFGIKSINFLAVTAAGAATFSLISDTAYYSFVPTLVRRGEMLRANSRLETGRQTASISGAAMAGFVLQTFGPPLALCIDSATYLLSAVSLSHMPADEMAPDQERVRLEHTFAQGISYVLRDRLLVSLPILGGAWNFFWNAYTTLYFLFLSRVLMLSTTYISLVIAAQSCGLVAGAWVAPRLARRVKIGWCIGYGSLLSGGASLIAGLLSPGPFIFPLVSIYACFSAVASSQSGIAQLSIRQSAVPQSVLTSVNTTVRFVFWGMLPLGALAGGAVASHTDLRHGVVFASTGLVLAAAFGLVSPVGRLKDLPQDT